MKSFGKKRIVQKYLKLKPLFITLFLSLISTAILGQTGMIKGNIIDSITKDPLIGATILVEGLSIGAISDENGDFTINQVPSGSYQLKSIYFSYKTTLTNIIVHSEETSNIAIVLNYEEDNKIEVKVVGKINRESEGVLLMEQKNTLISTQSIGAQELSRKGVGDAESAVSKVAGISKQDGAKNVFIRGLEDRYNVTLLNGLPIPSEDPEYKNIALEIFGTDIIQNIGINKVFSAKNSGDVGGAIININSKEMIKDYEFSLNISSGINTSIIGTKFLKLSGTNYLGISNAKRPVANQFEFANKLDPSLMKMPLNQSYKVSGGKRFKFGNNVLSVYGVAVHKTAFTYTEGILRNTNTAGIIYQDEKGSRYSNKISQLGLANVKYTIGNKHFIAYNFMLFHANNQYVGEYSGKDVEKFQDSDEGMGYLRRQQTNNNLLLTHQLLSKWALTEKLRLSVDFSYNTIKGLEPDRRENYLSQKKDGTYGLTGSNRQKRFFSELKQQDYSSKVIMDYKLKDSYNSDLSKIAIGFNSYISNTDFEAIEYNFSAASGSFDFKDITLDDVYTLSNYQEGKFKMTKGVPNSYNVSKNIYSAFAEGVYQLTKSLVGNIGFRYDYVDMKVAYNIVGHIDTNSIEKHYYLPSLNLKYALNERNVLRLGVSKTYTLPQSKEISPYQYVDISFASEGNPKLQPSDNYNVDLKWDNYFSRSEIVSVALFYKHIINPVGRVDKGNSAGLLTYDNISKQANVFGIELETRKNLFIMERSSESISNKLSLGLNASYIFSELTLELVNTPVRKSSLAGSSPFIVNTDITYSFSKDKKSLMTSLVFNYFSDKIYTNGTLGFKDIIERGRATLDFVFSYKFNSKFGINFKTANLLNPSFTLVRESSVSNEKIILSHYKKGMNISLGITITL